MVDRVKAIARMKQRALETGNTLIVDGETYNSTQTQAKAAKALRKSKPAVEPTPEPAPPPPTVVEAPTVNAPVNVTVDTTAIARAISEAMASVPPPAAPVIQGAEPIKKWKFTVNRDNRGLIQTIEAEAE